MAHVLVVDDEGDSRELLERYLGRIGHRLSSAANGRDGLQRLLSDRPDVVVLDIRMPEMDGVGLLEVMRSYLRWHNLPVIILSAHATPEQLQRVQAMGVIRVFHKAHFDLPELAAAIDDATGMLADTLTRR
ncbi:MAG TPA: response regulator [Tepidisphaeraceae bacterium]|jgi:CheY-like chemotaxis protein